MKFSATGAINVTYELDYKETQDHRGTLTFMLAPRVFAEDSTSQPRDTQENFIIKFGTLRNRLIMKYIRANRAWQHMQNYLSGKKENTCAP